MRNEQKKSSLIDIKSSSQIETNLNQIFQSHTEKLEKSFTLPKDCVFITRLKDKKVVNVNDAFISKIGPTREGIVGKSLASLPIWKNKNDHKKFLKVLSEFNNFNSFETVINIKSGNTLPVIIFGGVIQFDGEDCIFAALRDISKSKQVEKFLLESESKYRTLFEQSGNAIFLENESANIIDANKTASDLFGYTHKELLSMKMSALLIRREDKINSYTNPIGEPPFEVLATHKNGKTFWIDMTVAPLGIEGKQLYLSIIRNITERKVFEEQLEQAAKMETVGRLTGSIAHDFNNVLTIIQGFSELAIATINDNEPVSNYLLEISKASVKAESLIRQLLAFSRKQSRKLKIIDLNDLINSMKYMFDRIIGENIDLDLKLTKQPCKVKADPGQIEQVILNLIVNARDAISKHGTIKIKTGKINGRSKSLAKLQLQKTGSYVFLEVSDSGIGMDKNIQEHIFEPFFTTKNINKGTGLGLSTVYRIVKNSNGQINLQSEPGKGTTFCIILPESKSKKSTVKKTSQEQQDMYGTETILVVEDQEELRSVISQTLKVHGYKVFQAENGKKAVSIFKKNKSKINLLLTDIIMPSISGYDLGKSLHEISPTLKTLFMSGYNEEVIGKYGSIISEKNYIQKPFTPPTLLKKIKEVLK
ncbi:PAS domain S-box protein [Calditrichota bacterium]